VLSVTINGGGAAHIPVFGVVAAAKSATAVPNIT
jgi:hypothetical protein